MCVGLESQLLSVLITSKIIRSEESRVSLVKKEKKEVLLVQSEVTSLENSSYVRLTVEMEKAKINFLGHTVPSSGEELKR